MLTLERLKSLKPGDVICIPRDGRNGPERWKVNGKVQTWKRDPSRVRVPVKHGLYSYAQIMEQDVDSLNRMFAYIEGEE